jgi:histidine triad (HIT) family protein
MSDCILCQIVKGKLPCYKVYEDKDFLGFLDIRPLTKGNSLLIPKKHYRWVDDVPNFGAYWEAARKISKAINKSLGSYTTCYLTLGFEVAHAHIRIIPRYKNKEDDQQSEMVRLEIVNHYSEAEMKKIAHKIFSAVRGGGA